MAPSSVWFGSSGNKLKESSELFRSDLLQSPEGSVGEFDTGREDDLDDDCEVGCDGGRVRIVWQKYLCNKYRDL